MTQADDAIREEFVAEAVEHLNHIEAWLAQVRSGDTAEARIAVHSIFRAFHSVKGCANFLGLDSVARLCHELETLLSLARHGDIEISPHIWDVTAEGTVLLGAMVDDLPRAAEIDLAPLIARIRETVRGAARDDEVARLADTPLIVRLAGTPVGIEVKLYAAEKAIQAGQRLFLLQVDLVRECDGKGRSPLDLLEWLSSVGDVLGTGLDPEFVPDVFETDRLSVPFFIVYATLVEPGIFAGAADLDPSCVLPLVRAEGNVFDAQGSSRERATRSAPPEPPAPAPEIPGDEAIAEPEEAPREDPPSMPRAVPAIAATVRVGVETLDRLLRLSGDLIAVRNDLTQRADAGDPRACARAGERLRAIEGEIRQTVLQARMQPAGTLFRRFPQLARDLARETGKEVEVVVEGTDIELDRTAVEALVDPLTHLVRNAMDHGIESPDERRAADKPALGRLALRASRQGGHVVVEIEDDGRGIDRARVLEKAVALSIVEPGAAARLSPRAILDLIFLPGLSTAKEVTKISGRGVGMDVVKGNVERIGGSVDVASEPGRGTSFRLKIPMTLALVSSAIVRCGRSWFAIPEASIRELVCIHTHGSPEIARVRGQEVLRRSGGAVPIVRLGALAGGCAAEAGRGGFAAVVRARAGDHALIADEIADLREIVVMPFGRRLKGSPLFSGAAALGDRRIALILDIEGIVEEAHLRRLRGTGMSGAMDVERVGEAVAYESAAGVP